MAGDRGSEPVDEIVLTLPALATFSRVARLAIAGIATRLELSYDDIEDLRIAVGEIYGLLGDDPSDRIRFRCLLASDSLTVEATRLPEGPGPDISDLSLRILAGVVDDLTHDPLRSTITVRKLRQA